MTLDNDVCFGLTGNVGGAVGVVLVHEPGADAVQAGHRVHPALKKENCYL